MNVSKKAAILLTAAVIITLAVPAVGQPERGIEVGQRIEPRPLKTMESEQVMVPLEEGLTVILFWSTWSPRSEPALKLWQKFGDQYAEKGLSILTVNADHQEMSQEDIQEVREYVEQKEILLPVILDSDLELFNEIGIIVLPTVLFMQPDGTMDYKYAGFPTSAELDLKGDLEAKLGIAREPSAEEKAQEGEPVYTPQNNALLFYNMGTRLSEKGFGEKAKDKYVEALQRDPEYSDPLRALEGLFFEKGRTPEAEESLKSLLTQKGLEGVIGKISDASEAGTEEGGPTAPPEKTAEAQPGAASADTSKPGTLSPMERMRLLMEKKGN